MDEIKHKLQSISNNITEIIDGISDSYETKLNIIMIEFISKLTRCKNKDYSTIINNNFKIAIKLLYNIELCSIPNSSSDLRQQQLEQLDILKNISKIYQQKLIKILTNKEENIQTFCITSFNSIKIFFKELQQELQQVNLSPQTFIGTCGRIENGVFIDSLSDLEENWQEIKETNVEIDKYYILYNGFIYYNYLAGNEQSNWKDTITKVIHTVFLTLGTYTCNIAKYSGVQTLLSIYTSVKGNLEMKKYYQWWG